MSSNMQVRFFWDGELSWFAMMKVPVKLIPKVGDHMRTHVSTWIPDGTDEDGEEDGGWSVKNIVPSVVLERRVDLIVMPTEKDENGVPYDDDPSMFVAIVLGRIGEERAAK